MNIVRQVAVKQLIDGFDVTASNDIMNVYELKQEGEHLTTYDGYGPNGYEENAGRLNVTILYSYDIIDGTPNLSRTVSASFCTVTGNSPAVVFNLPSTITINNA